MMKYLALYRKYRPLKFEEITGQDNVVSVLSNAINNGKISHAYLFFGPRGTGKTTTAKLLAKMVNCENLINGEPCGKCNSCLNIANGITDDIIEIDAASNNGVDEIRELRDKVNLVPSNCKYKVYIIDEVHMLTTGAFNALLKTLEEPPSHIIFVLATTENFKVPLTISSRCQKFRFDKITVDNIVKRLKEISILENIKIDDVILKEIARISDGGMRDAINLLDQLISYKGENVTISDVYDISGIVNYDVICELLNDCYNNDINKIIDISEEVSKSGKSISKFIEELILFLRDMLIFKNTFNKDDNDSRQEKIEIIAKLYSENDIYDFISNLNNVLNDIKTSSYPLMILEISLIKFTNKNFKKNDKILNAETVKIEIKDVKFEEKDIKKGNEDVIIKNGDIKKDIDKELKSLKNIRINNAFANANKTLLIDFKKKWQDVFSYFSDEKYEKIVGLLKDVDVSVVGVNNIIFTTKYLSIADSLNKESKKVTKLLKEVYKNNYQIVALIEDEWEIEKNKYKENIKKKIKYNLIEEPKKNNENIKQEVEENELISILGKELVEFK